MKNFLTKDRLRFVISIVLSFIVCLGLFVTVLCADLLFFFNEKSILSVAKKSNYTDFAIVQLTEDLNDLAIPSGLPEDFFTGKINKAEFEELFYSSIENLASGNKDYKLSVDEFKREINELVTNYSKNDVGDFSSDVERDIENFSNECGNIYLSYVNPSLTSYLLGISAPLRKYLAIGTCAALFFTLVVAFIVFKLNYTGKFIKFCFGIFGGAALCVGAVPLYLIATNEISRIAITSKCLYALITTLAMQLLWIMLISACIIAFIALIFLAVKIFKFILQK